MCVEVATSSSDPVQCMTNCSYLYFLLVYFDYFGSDPVKCVTDCSYLNFLLV